MMIRYAKLPLHFDAEAAQQELIAFKEAWQPHFNTSHYEGSWTVLALRSPSGHHHQIAPDLMGQTGYQDTGYLQQFPSVQNLLGSLHCEPMSVRFLNLTAGAVIKRHTDNVLSLENGEVRLHFPVFTNPGVKFYLDDERLMMAEGDCWYINAHLPHSVSNEGNADRIHLVADCKVNDWLTNVIHSSAEIAVKDQHSNSELLLMIRELRLQNTRTSNKLAHDLEQQLK